MNVLLQVVRFSLAYMSALEAMLLTYSYKSRVYVWHACVHCCCQLSGGIDWRGKLDSQRGAVLATELKNNSCKLAKWTVASILAGSDTIKFGLASPRECHSPQQVMYFPFITTT